MAVVSDRMISSEDTPSSDEEYRTAKAFMMQVKHPELIGQGMQQRIDFITGKTLTNRPKKAPAQDLISVEP